MVKAERFRANLLPYAIGQTPIKIRKPLLVGPKLWGQNYLRQRENLRGGVVVKFLSVSF